MSLFHTRRRVEFGDTDMAGIMHFSNFFRFMEAAECDFLRSLGLSVKMEAEGVSYGFPRVSATCDFQRPARFEDVVEIAVSLARLGEKSVTYAFEFSLDSEILARGQVTSVCCRVEGDGKLKAIPIPEAYRRLLQSCAADGKT